KGLGVIWESQLTRTLLYGAEGALRKVVPVCFSPSGRDFIPDIIRFHTTSYLLDAQYDDLLRYLTGQPAVVPDALGPIRVMTPRESVADQASEPSAFAQSIVDHMASLDRLVEKLTHDQLRVINHVRLLKRVRISGLPGSGKTLVAAEKAI